VGASVGPARAVPSGHEDEDPVMVLGPE